MFLTRDEINKIGFKSVGSNVLISDKAVFYRPERISIGNNVRIDDFCVLANNIVLGDYIHIALYTCLLSGPNSIIEMKDFSGLAYRVLILTTSDNYSGLAMTNPTIPDKYRLGTEESITIGKHCVIGAGSIVLPGANLAEGVSVSAMSLVTKPTQEWKFYAGIPARIIQERKRDLLDLETSFMKENARFTEKI